MLFDFRKSASKHSPALPGGQLEGLGLPPAPPLHLHCLLPPTHCRCTSWAQSLQTTQQTARLAPHSHCAQTTMKSRHGHGFLPILRVEASSPSPGWTSHPHPTGGQYVQQWVSGLTHLTKLASNYSLDRTKRYELLLHSPNLTLLHALPPVCSPCLAKVLLL